MNAPLAGRNRRILVIDDNRAIHEDFGKILCPAATSEAALHASEIALFGDSTDALPQAQFEVHSAYQGQDGVLMAQRAREAGLPYAVAFVDVRMPPGWDGVETTQKLWALDPSLQVVLCTAYSDYSWGELFAKLGHSDGLLILKKPFDAVEALQLAHALTAKWELHEQARQKVEDLEGRVLARTRELASSVSLLHATLESTTDGIAAVDLRGELVSYNKKFADIWQFPPEMLARRDAAAMRAFALGQFKDSAMLLRKINVLEVDPPRESADVIELKDGRTFERYIFPQRIHGECVGTVINWRDITERKRLEARLFQSQKMETVGKLAGGVAHEFNSILTAIIGQSDLLLNDLPAGDPLNKNATEIRNAADRAASLTRQLLAYASKQVLQPEILYVNVVLTGMESTLRHLMGRGVDVRVVPNSGLKAVKADAGQIEQVIMNLAMNAADAMSKGGKLTLETANVTLGLDFVDRAPDVKVGEYVMLAVTDTGAGMCEEVRARVFDPFFSTKGVGQGTGLGLSTCYGIVKQSGGQISVYSEVGRGTTFRIYLPQVEEQAKSPGQRLDTPSMPRGTETILLVEDDPALRAMAATLLGRLGYTVLAAVNGVEALALSAKPGIGHIDLLFTDVVMPHMSGRELADRVHALYPLTRIVFTSAYTENAIVHQGVLSKGVVVLQKPFTPSTLAHTLRAVLDKPVEAVPELDL